MGEMAGFMAAQVAVVAQVLTALETLAQAATERMALLLLQLTSNYEIRYCRRPHKSRVEPHPLGWRCSLHASCWH
jgi:hypothetical protein